MKKLLSALFILGSVSALATVDHPGGGGQPDNGHGNGSECYTNTCKVDRDVNIFVKIPKKLEMSCLNDIELGPWCGTKPIQGQTDYSLDGEKDAKVKIYFASNKVEFKEGNKGLGFYADMFVDGQLESKKNLNSSGKSTGIVKAKVSPIDKNNKNHIAAGGTYKATAKLIAEYDSF